MSAVVEQRHTLHSGSVCVSDLRLVVVRGGGDIGTGSAVRLARAGLRVLVSEVPHPTAVRRTVAFSEAVFEGEIQVEDVTARLADTTRSIENIWSSGMVPVVVDPTLEHCITLKPDIIVDARLAKRMQHDNLRGSVGAIGLGPGFTAPDSVDAVVETNRGPDLGRVIWNGVAEPHTGKPASVLGRGVERVLRAPTDGLLENRKGIGEIVGAGEVIAEVHGRCIQSQFAGLVRGLLRSGSAVKEGMKVGDVDPRMDPNLCYRISDKALAIAGGVLEASLMLLQRRDGSVLLAREGRP